jgi:uncharacterized membrane protein YdjX (TVP38/TMEM64 family)
MPAKKTTIDNGMGRLLARAQVRAALPFLVAGGLLLSLIGFSGYEVGHHISAIESSIVGLGPWGGIAFVVFFAVSTSVLVPESVLSMSAGALFGLGWGVAAAVAGALLGAVLQYGLSRWLLRAPIQRALAARPALAAIQRAVLRDELRLQLLLRLAPLSFATVSYVLGAAGVRFAGFLLACLCLVPHILVEVYFGHAGMHVARRVAGFTPASALHDLVIAGGLAVSLVALALVSRRAHQSIMRAVAESELDEAQNPTSMASLR